MQALAYEGYFNNGHFYTDGKVMQLPEKRRVFLAILDEAEIETSIEPTEQNESAQEWLNDLLRILQDDDSDLDESDFPRISFRKPEELFANEVDL
jgi:hypothetical protein